MIAAAPRPTAAPTGMPMSKAPRAILPGEHFAAALAFLIAGAVGLVVVAGDIARGTYLEPRVAATTHLFTLGWITTSILGALYQFLPVALDQPIRSERAAHTGFVLHVPGLALFVSGLATSHTALLLTGAMMFGTGIALFIANMALTLARAKRRDVTWFALACATVYLAATLGLGVVLAAHMRSGYLPASLLRTMGVHIHVAVAGWVLLVMVGVGNRLLPMFLLSHGVKSERAVASVVLIATGVGAVVVFQRAHPVLSTWLPATFLTFGAGAFLLQGRNFFEHRVRPALDAGMRLAAAALILLVVTIALGWMTLLAPSSAHLRSGYVAAMLMSVTLFVAAHYYKIVPFLVWYHRFGPLVGRQQVPRVADLYSAPASSIAVVLLVAGAAGFALATSLGAAPFARHAAIAFTVGALIEAGQMVKLWRIRP